MRALRWFFVILILICLSPVIAAGAAEAVAYFAHCQIAEPGFGQCLVRGYDINDLLLSMQSMAWLTIWGGPAAFFAALLWIVMELVGMTVGRNPRSLRF